MQGKRFGDGAEDWALKHGNVPAVLRAWYERGYKVAIISNQLGVGKGKVDKKVVRVLCFCGIFYDHIYLRFSVYNFFVIRRFCGIFKSWCWGQPVFSYDHPLFGYFEQPVYGYDHPVSS